MKRLVKVIIALSITIVLLAGFYFFYPHVWGEIVYPLDYKDSVVKYAKERNLRPNFLAALIYTESHFNAQANSGVGARGLMQIMPATGGGIADELGEGGYSADKLYDPETNIRYGSYYIKGLLDKYDGNVDLALAGYNAGVPRADKWKDGVSDLPFETVFFIDKVKNAEEAYTKTYGIWVYEPEVKKPNPFYQGINNFSDFVKKLIVGQ